MNKDSRVVPFRSLETIENEAADWLVKLDSKNITAEDRLALKRWLSEDAEHLRVLKNLTNMWTDMDFVLNEALISQTPVRPNLFSWLIRSRMLATAFLLFCSIGVFIWFVGQSEPVEKSFHTTGVGMQHIETLSDGSIAHLNTNSMMEVEYSGDARIIRLLRGEAMFDVIHDIARPFIVYAGDQEVKAIGTKFIVRINSENIVVMVTDGQIQLSRRSQGRDFIKLNNEQQEVILVNKGEELRVADNNSVATSKAIEMQDDELKRKLSWLKGQLVFDNEPLEKVIQEISRYVPDHIVIEDPDLRDIRISGRFEIGDTDALLEAIEVSFGIQVSHIDDEFIRISRQ